MISRKKWTLVSIMDSKFILQFVCKKILNKKTTSILLLTSYIEVLSLQTSAFRPRLSIFHLTSNVFTVFHTAPTAPK